MSRDARLHRPTQAPKPHVDPSTFWRGVNVDARRARAKHRLTRRQQALFEALPSTVFEVQRDGALLVLHAGSAAAAIALGVGAHRPGDAWRIANDNALPDTLRAVLDEALATNAPARGTGVLLGIDHELSVAPLGDGEALCVLREASTAPSAAHDMNNFLTSAVCSLDAIADDGQLTDDARANLEVALEALRRIGAVTRQMLARGRALRAPAAPADLGQELLALTPLLRRILPNEVNFFAEIDPDMPHARLVPGHLQRVVMNLVSNAGQAVRAGGSVTLAAWGDQSDPRSHVIDRAMIEVIDDGCGMAPAVVARVFEPWFTTRANEKGHGLGMATVRAMIHESGGHIDIESFEGIGTRVRITLPAFTPRISAAVEAPPLNDQG